MAMLTVKGWPMTTVSFDAGDKTLTTGCWRVRRTNCWTRGVAACGRGSATTAGTAEEPEFARETVSDTVAQRPACVERAVTSADVTVHTNEPAEGDRPAAMVRGGTPAAVAVTVMEAPGAVLGRAHHAMERALLGHRRDDPTGATALSAGLTAKEPDDALTNVVVHATDTTYAGSPVTSL